MHGSRSLAADLSKRTVSNAYKFICLVKEVKLEWGSGHPGTESTNFPHLIMQFETRVFIIILERLSRYCLVQFVMGRSGDGIS